MRLLNRFPPHQQSHQQALLLLLGILLFEPLHSPFRIYNLLRAGEERMAFGTDIDIDIANRRMRLKRGPTCTMHRRYSVIRMNRCFHDAPLCR